MNVIKILHITPHLGGGVGKALSGILVYEKKNKSRYTHLIYMLEEPQNNQFVNICMNNEINVNIAKNFDEIYKVMKSVDIVVLHWWHHPLNAKFLAYYPQIPARLIIWSHINGCSYPVIPADFIKAVNKVFFTSEYSLENHFWNREEKEYACKNAKIVYGLGELNNYSTQKIKKTDNFIIGYIGTLNYSKLNPEFIEYCLEVIKLIPSAHFVFVGNPDGKEALLKQADKYGIGNNFEFTGYVNNVDTQLDRFDIFAYPLNPDHFGTTENAVLEAMNHGLPVVVLNQNCEKYLVKHNETGFLADDKYHYSEIIKYLYDNPDERLRIGSNAQKIFLNEFSMKKNINQMREGFSDVLFEDKKEFNFQDIFGKEPYQWFLSCLGEERRLFEDSLNENLMRDDLIAAEIKNKIKNCRGILREKSKSSIIQFAEYFQGDKNLKFWRSII